LATGVAEARALSAGLAGRIYACASYVRFAWLRDVIRLGYPGWSDGRAARAIATRRALRRGSATLGDAFHVFGGVAQLHFLAHPAILQRDLWIGMAIRVV
jgi:hypothetical protein